MHVFVNVFYTVPPYPLQVGALYSNLHMDASGRVISQK